MLGRQGLSMQKLKKFGKDGGSSFQGSNVLHLPNGVSEIKIKEKGKRLLDFMPYEVMVDNHPAVPKGELWHERTYLVHWKVGPDKISLICPKSIGQRCPICLRKAPLYDLGYEAHKKEIGELTPQKMQLWNVKDLDTEEKETQLWNFSFNKFFKELKKKIDMEENEDLWGYPMLECGFTIQITFIEDTYMNSKFLTTGAVELIEREKQYTEEVVQDSYDLDAMLVVKSYEEIESIQMGTNISGENVPPPLEPDVKQDEPEPAPEPAPEPELTKVQKERSRNDVPVEKKEVKVEKKEDAPDIPEGCVLCVACEGKGMNSAGTRKCNACNGDGYKEGKKEKAKPEKPKPKKSFFKDDSPKEKDEPEAAPEEKKEEDNELDMGTPACPSEHEFGEADKHPECEECPCWEPCMEFKASMMQKKREQG